VLDEHVIHRRSIGQNRLSNIFDIFRRDVLHEDLQLVPEETSARDRFRITRTIYSNKNDVIRLVKFLGAL
jgi:hypothetical protein